MVTQTGRRFLLRACVVCKGDAYLDLSDEPVWRCLQCGRVVPPETTQAGLAVVGEGPQAPAGAPANIAPARIREQPLLRVHILERD